MTDSKHPKIFRARATKPAAMDRAAGEPLMSRGGLLSGLKQVARTLGSSILDYRRGKRIPVVPQAEAADCAAACLAMSAAVHGIQLSLADAKAAVPSGRDGATARALLDGARRVGLRGRAVMVELARLDQMPRGSILHWRFTHFVVFDHAGRDAITIVDPALGRRRVPWAQVDQSFTGVGMIFEPGTRTTRPAAALLPRPWSYARAVLRHRAAWARVISISVALQIVALATPFASGFLIDRVIPFEDLRLLRQVVLAGTVVAVALFILTAARALAFATLRAVIDARLSSDVFEHLLGLPYPYFQTRSTGDLLLRIRSGAAIRQIVTTGLLSSFLDGGLIILSFALLARVDPSLALLAAGAAIVEALAIGAAWPTLLDLARTSLEVQSRTQNNLVQTLTGIETIKAGGWDSQVFERWSNVFTDELNVDLDRSRVGAVLEALMTSMRFGAPFAVMTLGMFRVLEGSLSAGTAIAAGMLTANALIPLGALFNSGIALSALAGYAARLDDLLHEEPEAASQGTATLGTFTGHVRLRDVGFTYPGSSEAGFALEGVSLEIPAGSFVALVGPSGAGKSTLAMVIAGLLKPSSGEVYYDGVGRSSLDLPALRRRLGVVTQHGYLFSGSIRDNLALWSDDVSEEALKSAAALARIHDEIAAMPLGFDTLLSDSASNISGGQRQRLALARALSHRPSLLVLDEATSAVDAQTEGAIIDSLRAEPLTLVVVTHRLETVRDADLILAVDNGKIEAARPR